MKKVLVIGAGNVGAHIIQYAVTRNIGAEFYLLDINEELEKAQILDLKDTLLFSEKAKVEGINFDDPRIEEMDIIVVTAGANQGPGETRCDLLKKNTSILQSIASGLENIKSSAIVLLVTNPVDILTHIAYDLFDLPKQQIFGTGTLLDSARLKWRLAEKMNINIKNVHGWVLGEHGDSEFVAWSTVGPLNTAISQSEKEAIELSVQRQAYEIIEGKGATYFGISAATNCLLNAIIHDTKQILPVSTIYPYSDHKSLQNVPIGVPATIGANGVEQIMELQLTEEEFQKLRKSADKLCKLYGSCPI